MALPVDPPALAKATIEVEGVSKWYGDKVAVSDLSFTVGPGVTALLGPNGAGKSTTLKMLTGQLRPSQGRVRVLGRPVIDNPSLYRRIGLVPEQEELYPFLSGREFVELAARLHRLPRPRAAARAALATVDLLDAQDRKLRGYSKGMRQRVKIAQALVHDPEILFLDEPLTGADPRQRLALMEVFERMGGAGRTVLISSHILSEVERMGVTVLVIARGKLAAEGDFHQIRALMDEHPRRVRVQSTNSRVLAAALVGMAGTRGLEIDGETLVVETTAALELYHALPWAAQQGGIRLQEITGLDDDLESVFRYLVG
ncbi:MAG TPA: ABC transporter ATP-binding protein [Chloroflexota bacterium]|nr:ABC transporter ATP-binding protein [Chloroflexota bacterium]